MSNIAKWTAGAGQGLTWGAAFNASDFASLANATVAVSSVVIDNSTALDLYADLSISLTGTTPSSGAPFLAVYLLPLNQDGSTYGAGSATGATSIGSNYIVGSIMVPLGKSSVALTGMVRGIVLPVGKFKFAAMNEFGNALSSSGHSAQYRTYNETMNG